MLIRKHLLLSAGLLALATLATPALAGDVSFGLSYSGGDGCYSIGRTGGFISFGRPSYDCYDTRTIYNGYTRHYDRCAPLYSDCTPVYRDCDTRVVVREAPRRRVVRRHYQREVPQRTIVRRTYSPSYRRVVRSSHAPVQRSSVVRSFDTGRSHRVYRESSRAGRIHQTPRYERSLRHAPTRHHGQRDPHHRRVVRHRR